jgi:hypothetical protein
MRVRLFGELEAEHAGVPVPIRGVKQRALLTLLALHRGQPVSADRLIEVLWGDGQAAHPAAYASSYRQAPLWLSPGELAELARKCSGPAGPRRQQARTWPSVYLLSPILFPTTQPLQPETT